MHTKGNWELAKNGLNYRINAGDKHIAMVSCMSSIEEEKQENIDNTSLILAAPRMLEVLEMVLLAHETAGKYSTLDPGQAIQVRCTILSAKGEKIR